MTEINNTLMAMALPPGIKLLIDTLISTFGCVVGSWILFGQWWIEIEIRYALRKGRPAKTYSLAPGGGILLAIGIYFLPTPTNGYEWIGLLTSSIKPYWWIPLVIDPFHIMVVSVVPVIAIPYWFRRYWKRIPNAETPEKPCNQHNSKNREDLNVSNGFSDVEQMPENQEPTEGKTQKPEHGAYLREHKR